MAEKMFETISYTAISFKRASADGVPMPSATTIRKAELEGFPPHADLGRAMDCLVSFVVEQMDLGTSWTGGSISSIKLDWLHDAESGHLSFRIKALTLSRLSGPGEIKSPKNVTLSKVSSEDLESSVLEIFEKIFEEADLYVSGQKKA